MQKRLASTLLGFLIVLTVWAQEKSLLWEISGNGLTESSYLFGTIHLIPKADFFLPEGTEEALKSCKRLVLEMDITDPGIQFKLLAGMKLDSAKSLKDFYTPKEYAFLAKKLEKKYDMNLEAIQFMKPVFVQQNMMITYLKEGEFTSYEGHFMKLAEAGNISVFGLETLEDQLAAINSMPDSLQARSLLMSVKSKKSGGAMDKLVKLYKNQDVKALYRAVISDKSQFKEFENELLINRNKKWIPVIKSKMAEQKVFVAVGAAHLGGEQGVIALLRKEGYEVKPVNPK
jgi:uncharacterized protein YbaP (TraB family)